MDTILAPIDKSIAGIGKFIMERPRIACLLFIFILTVFITSVSINKKHDDYTTTSLAVPTASSTPATLAITTTPIQTPVTTPATIAPIQSTPTLSGTWHTITVKRNDNLARIFKRLKLNAGDLQKITLLGAVTQSLKHLQPKQKMKFLIGPHYQLQQLVYDHEGQTLTISRTGNGFVVGNPPMISPAAPIATQSAPTPAQTTTATSSTNTNAMQAFTLRAGDTLSVVFQHLHLSANDLAAVVKADRSTHILRKLKPGQTLYFSIANQQLEKMIYAISTKKGYVFTRSGRVFHVHLGIIPAQIPSTNSTSKTVVDTTAANEPVVNKPTITAEDTEPHAFESVSGIIHHSLYRDAHRAGLTNKQVAELVHIFNEDSAIVKNLRAGSQFTVLYNGAHKLANKLYSGDIVAAELSTPSGKTFQLLSFKDHTGKTQFYTPQGLNFEPPIVRAPIKYTYISSYFTEHRWHPLLHFIRPHLGVDYAAPPGTPIHAAGAGKIEHLGWEGGYGNMILIKHDNTYSTLYAHMSRYASGMHNGSFVTQGQVIGYVGSTGLATGPHLHFEIHVHNHPENPLTVALPSGTPIPWPYRKEFFSHTKALLAQLNLDKKRFADNAANDNT